MTNWLDIDAADNMPDGSVTLTDVDDREVAVFNISGRFYAIEDVCSHDGGTLADGAVDGHEIECPRHGARFDLCTGKVTAPPAVEDIRTYEVRIHEGRVQVSDRSATSDRSLD